jgi:hypothetical protein
MTGRHSHISLRRAAQLACQLRYGVVRAAGIEAHHQGEGCGDSFLAGYLRSALEALVRDLGGPDAKELVAAALHNPPTAAELALDPDALGAALQPASQYRTQRPRRRAYEQKEAAP